MELSAADRFQALASRRNCWALLLAIGRLAPCQSLPCPPRKRLTELVRRHDVFTGFKPPLGYLCLFTVEEQHDELRPVEAVNQLSRRQCCEIPLTEGFEDCPPVPLTNDGEGD